MRPSSCLAVAVWLLSVSAAAQPAALPLELSWQAPSECPAASDVHAELARIASAAPGEDLRPLKADVTVTKSGGRYGARLRTEHEGLIGERTLQAEDCATLTRSVTLVLALAFGRGVELREAAPVEAGASSEAPAATPAPAPATVPESTTPEAAVQAPAEATNEPEPDAPEDDEDKAPSALRFGVLLGGGAQLTLMPRVAPILTLGAALDLEVLALELRASALSGTSEPLEPDHNARAVVDGLLGTALACAHVSLADLCAGGRAGAIRARSRSTTEAGAKTAPWYALVAAAVMSWPEHGPLQLGLEALLAVSITRPRFEVTGYGTAHRVPLLAPEVSVLLRFWP